jgi:hypothetical protein
MFLLTNGSKHDKVCQIVVFKKRLKNNNFFSTLTLKKILKTYLNCILKS